MSYIENFDSYWLFASAIALGVYTFFSFVDGHLAKSYKENFTFWLWGDYQSTWAKQFCLLFDRIFGTRHLSWRCFFISSLASITFVVCLYILFGPVLGYLSDSGRAGENLSLGQAVIFGAILNVIPDYLSLYETRWLLNKFQNSITLSKQLIFLIIDLLLSSLIILLAIGLFLLLRGQTNITPAVIIGLFSVFSIFFYSTFFTSIWAWIYCLSTWFMKLFCKTPLKSILETETKPLKQIGLISSALIFVCAFALSPILKDSDSDISRKIDDLWCEHFESTCERLYYLTENQKKAYERLEKICKSGDIEFCLNQSQNYFKKDTDGYIGLYKKVCERGEAIACQQLSLFYREDNIAGENPELSFQYSKKACELGLTLSCFLVSTYYQTGYGVEEDLVKFHDSLKKACDLDAYVSCLQLGLLYRYGNDAFSADLLKARDLLVKSCRGGNGNACHYLGKLYQGQPQLNNNDSIAELFVKSCDFYNNYESACKDGSARAKKLGEKFKDSMLKFLLVSQDINQCQSTNARGCGELGLLYKKGVEVERNYKTASELLIKACNHGVYEVCTDLGLLYKNGWGVEKSYEKAYDAFWRACNVDHKGCYNLGVMYQLGLGVEKDLLRAKELFQKSCAIKNVAGCLMY